MKSQVLPSLPKRWRSRRIQSSSREPLLNLSEPIQGVKGACRRREKGSSGILIPPCGGSNPPALGNVFNDLDSAWKSSFMRGYRWATTRSGRSTASDRLYPSRNNGRSSAWLTIILSRAQSRVMNARARIMEARQDTDSWCGEPEDGKKLTATFRSWKPSSRKQSPQNLDELKLKVTASPVLRYSGAGKAYCLTLTKYFPSIF